MSVHGIPKAVVTGALLRCVEQMVAEHAKGQIAQALIAKLEEMTTDTEALAEFRDNPHDVVVETSIGAQIDAPAMLLFLEMHEEHRQQRDSELQGDPFEMIRRILQDAGATL